MVILDSYEYEINPDNISICLNGTNDPLMVDVLSELAIFNGKIYLEGSFYQYLDEYEITNRLGYYYLELKVIQTRR